MTDAEQLARTSEEMGVRKLAIALHSAVEEKAAREEKSVIDVSLNFVEVEVVVQDVIAKL